MATRSKLSAVLTPCGRPRRGEARPGRIIQPPQRASNWSRRKGNARGARLHDSEDARADRVDPAGGQYSVIYDTYKRPLEYIDEIGRPTAVTHDGRGRVTSYTYPEGFTTPVGDQEFFSYDDHNNTTTRTRTPVNDSSLANLVIQASWDQTWNKPVYIIDAMSHETNISYWPIGGTGASLIHQAIRPSPDGVQGRPTYTFTYNSFGKILTSTDPTNVVTSNTYDPSTGNLLSATVDPTGIDSIESYTYDTVGNVATVTDPNLYVTENQYDADRRKTYVLHHNGNVSAALLAAEHTIYDILGRVQEEDGGTQFNGITTSGVTWQMLKQTFYTPTSKVDHEFDGASDETIYTYDGMDRTTIVTDPLQRRVATVYDLAGETLYTWRGWNSATAPTASTSWSPSTYAGTGPVRYAAYTYFPNGEVAAVTDANNNLTSSTYDGFDRLAYLYFPSTTSGAGTSDTTDFEAYAYDPNGNRLSLQKRDGQVISYQYDNLNRQTLKILPNTTTLDVWSQYDLAGRPTSDYFGSATVLTTNGIVYSYDTAGRLTGENQFNIPMTYAYDNAGNRIRTTWPDNNWINYDFDGLNREWQIRENGAATSGGTVVATYVYDPLSRKKSLSLLNGASVGFGYDIASRLISLAQNFVTAPQDLAVTYQYTAASQLYIRSSNNALFDWLPTAASTPYVPDGLNRYASVNGVEYYYDGRGNLTSDGTNTYTFDVENRLLWASSPTAVTLSYDPLGRLQQTTANSTTTRFVYEGSDLVAEYDGSDNLLRRYVYGPGTDQPVLWYEGSTFATRNYLHTDERGSIIATSNNSGTVSNIYAYGPYGEQTSWGGSRFSYTGQTEIPEAHLYYYKARVYSPSIGRFLQTDPIGSKDDLDLYAYTHDDPINGADPSGLGCGSRVGDAPNCKTYGPRESGTPQKTRGANGQQHADASRAQAREVAAGAQARGERVDSTVYNRSAKNATGGTVDSNMRADSVVNTTSQDGTKNVYINEVTSPSQTNDQQTGKWDVAKASAPEGVRVAVVAEDAASILGRVGGKFFAAAPVIGALPTFIEAQQHPMTTMEFFWKAAGMEEIAYEKGWLPRYY